jgi:hypothetical protein
MNPHPGTLQFCSCGSSRVQYVQGVRSSCLVGQSPLCYMALINDLIRIARWSRKIQTLFWLAATNFVFPGRILIAVSER